MAVVRVWVGVGGDGAPGPWISHSTPSPTPHATLTSGRGRRPGVRGGHGPDGLGHEDADLAEHGRQAAAADGRPVEVAGQARAGAHAGDLGDGQEGAHLLDLGALCSSPLPSPYHQGGRQATAPVRF
jgi:hypothetical protein